MIPSNFNSNSSSDASSSSTRTCRRSPFFTKIVSLLVSFSILLEQQTTLAFLNVYNHRSPYSYSKTCSAFINHVNRFGHGSFYSDRETLLFSYNDPSQDSNTWVSAEDTYENMNDWEEQLAKRADGSLWSSFENGNVENGNDENAETSASSSSSTSMEVDDGEAWLDALSSIAAEEIEFINIEADRADKVRQMQEWGFESETIEKALGVAMDDKYEVDENNVVFEQFKKETAKTGFGMYLDDEVDKTAVESHTTVERDDESGELIRTQMVYVDEHTCIGCTHCAMVAQSTFFMEPEHGRARVFQQWGDDDETIQIAIETCPVDCIHYVPYEELEKLEIERRDQNINFKARLVSQAEYGGGASSGGPSIFTAPQKISGNMKARCNNCPSRGCADCPMYGVGKNPYFEKKEKERKERMAKRRMQEQMKEENRSVDL